MSVKKFCPDDNVCRCPRKGQKYRGAKFVVPDFYKLTPSYSTKVLIGPWREKQQRYFKFKHLKFNININVLF